VLWARLPAAQKVEVAFAGVGVIAGSGAAIGAAARALTRAQAEAWSAPWTLPGGALALRLDALASVFLLLIGVIGGLCAVFGWEYLKRHHGGHAEPRSLALYNLLLASMAVVVTANDLILLFIAWEVMTLSSWALVVSDHHAYSSRSAGLLYLASAHIATAALLAFVLLLSAGGNFQIDAIHAGAASSGVLFVLMLLGFGTKAGLFPLHVWLPDAHSAAPSHVSALMSAVMITMGFYGLARFSALIGPPAPWWGFVLIVLGVLGALGGILFALAQSDVKRVLAYSTIENAGITAIAFGVGLLGTALNRPVLAGIGWGAGFLHLWNHALLKSALFLGFGAIAQAVGSRQLDALGGLLQRWRLVGSVLIGLAGAMAALPGLNLFTSEWLLLTGLITGGLSLRGFEQIMLLVPFIGLALAGGLALACFARLAGIGLLGRPRSPQSASTAEPGWLMRGPIVVLALGCLFIAAFPAVTMRALTPAVRVVSPAADLGVVHASLSGLGWLLPALLGGTVLVLGARRLLAVRLEPARSSTWSCAYPVQTAAMQYSSTSFSEPLTRVMQPVLNIDVESEIQAGRSAGVWPARIVWSSSSPDRVLTAVYLRGLTLVNRASVRIRAFQKPRVTTSLLYIVLTVLLLLGLLFLPGDRA
jgi:formate hydrogenlyase subunit 3/multisubunit Na+/H+ antiporter MnhD subunit